jgi:ethanolaminephosphotransferase
MFFSTWETYHTHTLYLGVINGPTEGLLLACLFIILSGYYGPAIWSEPIAKLMGPHISALSVFGFSEETLAKLCFRDLWVALITISLLFTHIPFCIYNVYKARRAKGLPVAPVFLEWTPMAVFTFSVGAWLFSPYSTICSENHLVLFCVIMSFVFGRMTTKMILAHLTRQPFPYWTVMLWPLVGGAVLGNLPRFGFPAVSAQTEYRYLLAYLVFAAAVYFRWAWLVTTSICRFLGINCLTIPYDKQMENQRNAEAAAKLKRAD